jgi:hypothetical protein
MFRILFNKGFKQRFLIVQAEQPVSKHWIFEQPGNAR